MYMIYLPFAENFKELGKEIIKSLPFLIFPLGFMLNKNVVSKKLLQTFGIVYTVSVLILNIFGWIKVISFGWNNAWQQNDFYHPVFRNLFAEATSLHLPYLGLLSIFAALWLTYKMFYNKKANLFSIVSVLFILCSAYIYSARMALACYLIGLLFIVFKSIKKQTVKWSLLIALPLCAATFLWFSPLKERYITLVEKQLVLPNKNQQPHEVNYRYGIWHCATKLIADNFFTGVGADKVQEKLNECYSNFTYKSYEDFTKVTYNSHNQYFDQFLKFGIIGLLLFLFVLFYFYPNASILYQTFIIIVSISFLTENILDRQTGVVFVSLFNTICVLYKMNSLEKSFSS